MHSLSGRGFSQGRLETPMSNSDGFISEVSEEVRRDRLYAFARKWGWLVVLVIVAVIGAAAFIEWQKARARAEAEAAGDALYAALEVEDLASRADAIAELDTGGTEGRRALQALFSASAAFEAGLTDEALAQLEALSTDGAAPQLYRELATLKWAIIGADTVEPATRADRLSGLTLAGGAWRLLAEEQIALIRLEEGEAEAARELLVAILADQETTPDQLRRIEALLVALGGPRDAG